MTEALHTFKRDDGVVITHRDYTAKELIANLRLYAEVEGDEDLADYLRWSAEKMAEQDAELAEQKRRIETVLDLIDGREDASMEPGDERESPNLEMRIGMALRGEDRP